MLLLISLGAVPAAYANSLRYEFTDTGDYHHLGDPESQHHARRSGHPRVHVRGHDLLDLGNVGGETLPTAIPSGWGVLLDADVDNTSTADLHPNGNGAIQNGGQVGFYNTNFLSNLLLSETASPIVPTPEAATGPMLLVLSALTGVGVWVRRWRKR